MPATNDRTPPTGEVVTIRTLAHEAGHAVAAWALGIPFEYVTVDRELLYGLPASYAKRGSCPSPHLMLAESTRSELSGGQAYLIAVMLAAGRAGERVLTGHPSLVASDFGGSDDDRHLRRLARCFDPPLRSRAVIRAARNRARLLLHAEEDAAYRLVLALNDRRRLSSDDMHRLLGPPSRDQWAEKAA